MSNEQATVDELFDRFSQCWATVGGTALGDYFTEDGTLINPFGEMAKGRGAVAALYGEYFGTILRGTTTAVTIDSMRMVGPDHAFVDGDQTILGPGGETVMAVHMSALLRRESGSWLFVDARPYTIATVPV